MTPLKKLLIWISLAALLGLFAYVMDPVRPVNTSSAYVQSSGPVPGSRLSQPRMRLSVLLNDGRRIFIDLPLTENDYVGSSIKVNEYRSYVFGRHSFAIASATPPAQ